MSLNRLVSEALARSGVPMPPPPSAGWEGWRNGNAPRSAMTQAPFLEPSEESTLVWGNTASIGFVATLAESIFQQSQQLIHVARRRPTSYTVLTTLDLGGGWTGEGAFLFVVALTCGVGQARAGYQRKIPIPAPTNFSQVSDLVTIPATALNVSVALVGVAANVGQHDAVVTSLCAPVYA